MWNQCLFFFLIINCLLKDLGARDLADEPGFISRLHADVIETISVFKESVNCSPTAAVY